MKKKFDYQIIVINVQENKKKCCLIEYIKHSYIKLLMLNCPIYGMYKNYNSCLRGHKIKKNGRFY